MKRYEYSITLEVYGLLVKEASMFSFHKSIALVGVRKLPTYNFILNIFNKTYWVRMQKWIKE